MENCGGRPNQSKTGDALPVSDVGNHIILGLQPTTRLQDKDKYLLDAVWPAGVILFKSNFLHDVDYDTWLENQRLLIADIREAVGRPKLLIATDHEGARVCRTPPPVTRFKSASQWAPDARLVGAAMARELASLGLNMNFAPVLDIHTNPDNPVIGPRSFGSSPKLVGDCGTAFMEGSQDQAVWACAKHFPGHGDTAIDSHYDLPVVDLSKQQLLERELIPFKTAIDHDIRVIMTSHILFPQIDANYPATLSTTMTREILRHELGFQGVVISDDIGMHAMDRYFDAPDAARHFLEAGNDMLMVCAYFTDTARVLELATAMNDALADPSFRQQVHEPSMQRIERLLEDTTMHDVVPLPQSVFDQHATICGTFGDDTAEIM
jgi:beta-N-acetylhexosaminidase